MQTELVAYLSVTLEKEEAAALLALLEAYFKEYAGEELYRTTLQKIMAGLQARTDLDQGFPFRIYQQEAVTLWEVFGNVLPQNEGQAQVKRALLSKINECKGLLSVRIVAQDGPG